MANKAKFDVAIVRWNGRGEESYARAIRNILLPVVQKDIEISVPHGCRLRMANDGKFHIFIWSTVDGKNCKRQVTPPAKIYGFGVDCRDDAFQACGVDGESLIFSCPESGYAVAELFEDNLFIHHDLCHMGTSDELNIFKHLLTEVAASFVLTPEEAALRKEKELQKMREKTEGSREAFVEFCCRDRLQAIQGAEERIHEGKNKIEHLKKEMEACLATRNAACVTLEEYAESGGKGSSFGDEFDKMLTIPGVIGVCIEKNIIQVFTSMMRIIHDDITYVIGKFRVEINMYGGDHCLKFFNLTNKGKGPGHTKPQGYNGHPNFNRHHPHVNEEGLPCLGNIGGAIQNYIKASQYSVVVILAMQYLQAVNTDDDAGKGIRWWPRESV
jgi:hypothetical protein